MTNTSWVALTGLGLGLVLLVVGIWVAYLTARVRELGERLARSRADLDLLLRARNNLNGLVTLLGRRLKLNEVEQLRLRGSLDHYRWQAEEAADPQYRHAAQLARRGADCPGLVAACGLSEGEAELILALHGGGHYEDEGGVRPEAM